MALHELATNTLKYGALAAAEVHLKVSWTVIQAGGGNRRPLINWKESGVVGSRPNVGACEGGYGRELIEQALPYQLDAIMSFAFKSDSVHCTIDVAVPDAVK